METSHSSANKLARTERLSDSLLVLCTSATLWAVLSTPTTALRILSSSLNNH